MVKYFDVKTLYDREGAIVKDSIETHNSCPFCNIRLVEIQGLWRDKDAVTEYCRIRKLAGSLLITCFQCEICGWWEVRLKQLAGNYSQQHVYQALINEASINSLQIPIKELSHYISLNPDKIYNIHFKKMEALVRDLFAEHFRCEVIHCGQSHDKGIDLLMVMSDEVVPIQIKRRMSPGKVEPVNLVREMLGVMLRDGYKSAALVTTADRFSNESMNEIKETISKGYIEKFDLYNYQTFIDLLQQKSSKTTKSYLSVIPKYFGGDNPHENNVTYTGNDNTVKWTDEGLVLTLPNGGQILYKTEDLQKKLKEIN